MAAKKSQKTPADPVRAIIEATMKLAGESGWRGLRLQEVAREAGVSIGDVLVPYPTKYCIINAFQDHIDRQVLMALAEAGDTGEGPRDRLFDVMMGRFDALQPYKAGLAEIAKDGLCDLGSLAFLPRMGRSMTRMIEAAGISATGLRGVIRAKGLAVVYADSFRVWLKDDSEDMAKTMARLDRSLKRAEGIVSRLNRLSRPPRRTSGPDGTPADA